MVLDPRLLEVIACPQDQQSLLYFPDSDILYNPRLKVKYAIEDDIPIMLVSEAQSVDDATHAEFIAKAGEQ